MILVLTDPYQVKLAMKAEAMYDVLTELDNELKWAEKEGKEFTAEEVQDMLRAHLKSFHVNLLEFFE